MWRATLSETGKIRFRIESEKGKKVSDNLLKMSDYPLLKKKCSFLKHIGPNKRKRAQPIFPRFHSQKKNSSKKVFLLK